MNGYRLRHGHGHGPARHGHDRDRSALGRAIARSLAPALRPPIPGLAIGAVLAVSALAPAPTEAQGTRLLRQPTVSATQIAFAHGGDLWVTDRSGGRALRLTSTPAVESDPHFSPDGRWIAFTSNRSGTNAVYVVSAEGGNPSRLTWYPAGSEARGWTPDGSRVLYASGRHAAPTGYQRLWTVSPEGGPSELIPAPRGHDGSFSPGGERLVVEPVSRWDEEWKDYRGGQNRPLTILDLDDLSEIRLPNERTTDVEPVWMDGRVYFVSDRDWAYNVWAYDVASGEMEQLTRFAGAEVKNLSGNAGTLVFEQDGWIHALNPATGETERVEIEVVGDFPWIRPRWEDVSDRATNPVISPTGQRVGFEARGEILTVPVEHGDPRNLTETAGVADRAPVWSPGGGRVAWFSDEGSGYALNVAGQDGLDEPRSIDIGVSKMAWDPVWSPDGERIAFVDDDVRVRVVDVASGEVRTAGVGGTNLERGSMRPAWSPDSRWLAYEKTFPNMLRRIVVWNAGTGETTPVTNPMADARAPAWDRDGRHLWFLASTDVALGSGWANTSATRADPSYTPYVMVLRDDDPTPFPLRSDEEPVDEGEDEGEAGGEEPGPPPEAAQEAEAGEDEEEDQAEDVRIDFDGIARRIVALPMPARRYVGTAAGPDGSVFIGELAPDGPPVVHKFTIESREAEVFVRGAAGVQVSHDGEKLLYQSGSSWHVVGTAHPPQPEEGRVDVELRMWVDRSEEWAQMFDEAWHYERDFFYDPGLHGADWDAVRERYRPLVDHVRHRTDLTYVLDQMNGELSVGHSFVFGGDYPAVDTVRVGLLGVDFTADRGRWRIERIYTFESWNPGLSAPLDEPGLEVEEGDYLVGVGGEELTSDDDPYRLLDGTAGRQTVIHVNDDPAFDGHRTVTVEPIRSERALRRRAWVEDNRRRVDELSDGRLAYAWIPNTGGSGTSSFDRYVFAQQDREGLVIDERFNGGGLLDDYMVDLMTRELRAAITNEARDGRAMRLPAGILGPKVLLINEMAGSGGDFFPWVFRHQDAGPLVGTRTWGGLVRSSVHYPLVDGGALTAPDNAIFDPETGEWVAENEGVPPDVRVVQDARSVAEGRDPQLERAVAEALRLLEARDPIEVTPPPFSEPSRDPGGR